MKGIETRKLINMVNKNMLKAVVKQNLREGDLLVSTINLILLRFMYLSYCEGWVEKMPPPLLVPDIIKQEDINSIRIDCAHANL
jgi:hypothetical protein